MKKMMMTTVQEISKARELFKDREFTKKEWEKNINLTLNTAMNHHAVERIQNIRKDFVSVQELIDLLNSCAGEDCYGCDWNYMMDEQGKIYNAVEVITYRMI